jgi:putative transcriptional regulator
MDAMETLKGHLLISSGGLFDPNFRHTVVLVGEHNAQGALGVILNRALDVTVEKALPSLAGLVPSGTTLFEGGPVQRTSPVMLVELARPDLADILVFGAVGFLTGEVDADVRPHILRARIFAGYSGWSPGQLEAEMEADSWIVDPAQEDDVFTDRPDALWSRVLERKGPEFRRLSRMPYDPTMN